MKIEFRKVPNEVTKLNTSFNSVKIEGTFCRISPSLVKVEAHLKGEIELDCSRCAKTETYLLDEELKFLLSDGIFKGEDDDFLVIEVENSLINFDEIIQSEVNSIKSDYYICNSCLQDDKPFEQEF